MKQKLLIAGAAFFAVLLLFSGMMLYRQYTDSRHSAEVFESVADLVLKEAISTPHPNRTAESIVLEKTNPQITAFEKYARVYEQNTDFVGWISIEGTNINYPVMQTAASPNFYLKHGFDRRYSNYGVPYVQENCVLGISDNVIIYGHHMDNGSMFADLCKYESEDFYRAHKIICFDTLSGFGEYEIVAVFKTILYSETDFPYYRFVTAEDELAFDTFLSECKTLSLYDTGMSASYGDKLITLSTCDRSHKDGRMVVIAKEIRPSASDADGSF